MTSDVHGAYQALVQVLGRAGFDEQIDRLVVVGDVCDVWPEVDQVLEFLIGTKDAVLVAGNHDLWFLEALWSFDSRMESMDDFRYESNGWVNEGGHATLSSYGVPGTLRFPKTHEDYLRMAPPYFVDESNRLYVHGGFDPSSPIDTQSPVSLTWNRSFFTSALTGPDPVITRYNHVFIGHSPTLNWGKTVPYTIGNITNVDTGAGWDGRLSVVDADTLDFWQSDPVRTLYSNAPGRRDQS